ncbi:MAG: beta-ketoacyl-[acyl-carrier-protein] synthase family protein [Halanaerobiales bacterium]|nr:beta-ketoacyl-[acyl-carrier-protein] synthase family protein [Halanaerobiales bacterium]
MIKDIVVTGMGTLTAIGNNVDDFWDGLIQGRYGAGEITSFDMSEYRHSRGCELKNFRPQDHLSQKELHRMDRASILSVVAAREAIADAGIDLENYQGRIGVAIGTTLSGMIKTQEYYRKIFTGKQDRVLASKLLEYPLYIPGNQVIDKLGIVAEHFTVSTACSSGLHAIGIATDLLRVGRCDLVIAGGVDLISELTFSGFELLKALSNEDITPFDLNRKGLLLGDGVGIVVLEREDSAKARNANLYAKIAGYGSSSDAFHMTAPHKDAEGIFQSMKMALKDAKMNVEEIDYISAHGTGTKHNDAIETLGIKRFFGTRAYNIPVSSIKSMIGHTLGAAGAIETIAGILTIRHGIISPTINYQTPDPDCDLDYVPNVARKQNIRSFMNNSLGFGGNNAVLIVKEVG